MDDEMDDDDDDVAMATNFGPYSQNDRHSAGFLCEEGRNITVLI